MLHDALQEEPAPLDVGATAADAAETGPRRRYSPAKVMTLLACVLLAVNAIGVTVLVTQVHHTSRHVARIDGAVDEMRGPATRLFGVTDSVQQLLAGSIPNLANRVLRKDYASFGTDVLAFAEAVRTTLARNATNAPNYFSVRRMHSLAAAASERRRSIRALAAEPAPGAVRERSPVLDLVGREDGSAEDDTLADTLEALGLPRECSDSIQEEQVTCSRIATEEVCRERYFCRQFHTAAVSVNVNGSVSVPGECPTSGSEYQSVCGVTPLRDQDGLPCTILVMNHELPSNETCSLALILDDTGPHILGYPNIPGMTPVRMHPLGINTAYTAADFTVSVAKLVKLIEPINDPGSAPRDEDNGLVLDVADYALALVREQIAAGDWQKLAVTCGQFADALLAVDWSGSYSGPQGEDGPEVRRWDINRDFKRVVTDVREWCSMMQHLAVASD